MNGPKKTQPPTSEVTLVGGLNVETLSGVELPRTLGSIIPDPGFLSSPQIGDIPNLLALAREQFFAAFDSDDLNRADELARLYRVLYRLARPRPKRRTLPPALPSKATWNTWWSRRRREAVP